MFLKPSRFVDRIFLHCSASDHASHDDIKVIRKWHLQNGWNDVGYHYFVRKDGTLEYGRDINKTPAAQAGHNTATIAICLHGLDQDKFTEAQYETLKALCLEINNAYAGELTFHGHREVAAKACPVYNYKSILKLDGFGRLGLTGAAKVKLSKPSADKAPKSMPLIRHGSRGPAVGLAQRHLMIKDDGIFGPKTEIAVKKFQAMRGLNPDGIVGENTWKALFENERIEHSGAA